MAHPNVPDIRLWRNKIRWGGTPQMTPNEERRVRFSTLPRASARYAVSRSSGMRTRRAAHVAVAAFEFKDIRF
jgi:hypothetical protein